MMPNIYVGRAGWSIPKAQADQFTGVTRVICNHSGAPEGPDEATRLSHLERYGLRVPAVEINSSFYQSHRPATYARWAASVPADFRFSVKLPRQITHVQRLREPEEVLDRLLAEVEALEHKLGPVLVQLPPSLTFDEAVASVFFEALRARFSGSIVCEPRHQSWFQPDAQQMLQQFKVAQVAADPASPIPEAALPSGWEGIVYYRLHGSPRIYYSDYSEAYLLSLAQTLKQLKLAARSGQQVDSDTSSSIVKPAIESKVESAPKSIWCIFDNTAAGAATASALRLLELIALPDDQT